MLETSARRPNRSSSWACHRLAAGAVALGLLLSGCADEQKAAAPDPEPTPIANLNTAAMEVPRIEFCALVPDSAISEALAGKPETGASYGNGDEEELPGIGTDVVHEIGCSWTGNDGSTARAWVFARPISAVFARTVVDSLRNAPGCRTATVPEFGSPSATQVCRFGGGEKRVRHAGLFGQTWLTCELATNDREVPELQTRTDAWCVEVASALNAAR